ncbi:MAG: hypothetical protein SP4CHLAM5_09560 [Chlamydiia bacterium]|nr:hypothetical protein [Chlamydiia bacterium]MCH9618814.1 hypothetical protein [Chlamydiia bacterium]MCH9624661.1 hypothetical protein [Chlamydiia bacterium]
MNPAISPQGSFSPINNNLETFLDEKDSDSDIVEEKLKKAESYLNKTEEAFLKFNLILKNLGEKIDGTTDYPQGSIGDKTIKHYHLYLSIKEQIASVKACISKLKAAQKTLTPQALDAAIRKEQGQARLTTSIGAFTQQATELTEMMAKGDSEKRTVL